MLSPNFAKFFVIAMLISSASACRFFQTGEAPANKPNAATNELKSGIPFLTSEPDNFQAEIVVTANETKRTTLIAKNGANQRYDYNYGTDKQIAALHAEKNYLVLPDKKIFAENNANDSFSPPDEWQSFLTSEWLNQNTAAKFEKLETTENITKYRVTLNEKADSEILIYVDEKIGIPVKQEFFAGRGDEKSAVFSVEIKNLKLQADENLFTLPADFKKVSIEEFRKLIGS